MTADPNKIVFVLTCSAGDFYSAMTRVSAASARRTNPDVRLAVVCDAETDRAMRQGMDPLLREVDEWRTFETPPGSPTFRNRYLKTSLPERIAGPFLFLDSDTIVRGDLSSLYRLPGDLAAAPDHSRDSYERQISDVDLDILAAMGWSTNPAVHVNGGVLWVSGSPGAREAYRLWHDKWLLFHGRTGKCRDQAALNSAMFESQATCTVLPHRFNAQIMDAPLLAPDAVIWHYYSSMRAATPARIEEALEAARGAGPLPAELVDRLIGSSFLWPPDSWDDAEAREQLIGRAANDLRALLASDRAAGERMVRNVGRVDSPYARSVLVKAFKDAYWSGPPPIGRHLLGALARRFPSELAQPSVRRCLDDALRRCLRRIVPGLRRR